MILAYHFCWLCLIAAYVIWVVQVALWIVDTIEEYSDRRQR